MPSITQLITWIATSIWQDPTPGTTTNSWRELDLVHGMTGSHEGNNLDLEHDNDYDYGARGPSKRPYTMINMHMMQTNIGVQEQHNCDTDNWRDKEVDYELSLVQDNKVLTKTEIRLTKHLSPLDWGCNLEVQISNSFPHYASHQAPDHSPCKFQTGIE